MIATRIAVLLALAMLFLAACAAPSQVPLSPTATPRMVSPLATPNATSAAQPTPTTRMVSPLVTPTAPNAPQPTPVRTLIPSVTIITGTQPIGTPQPPQN